MRVLMFGWEFPPHISGGLGTACYGLTRALARRGHHLIFVIPRTRSDEPAGHLRLISASGTAVPASISRAAARAARALWERRFSLRMLDALLVPYTAPRLVSTPAHTASAPHLAASSDTPADEPHSVVTLLDCRGDYGADLMAEVYRYSQAAAALAQRETFDVIHAHDWMAFPAGLLARAASGRPLVLHVHSLEYDRSGDHPNPDIVAIERAGLEAADAILAVSHYTRQMIVSHYGISPDKIHVVHNAVSREEAPRLYRVQRRSGEKIVLFMGRITFQKGPDYFVEAAGLVLPRLPNVRFVMAGSGDMLPRMIQRVAELRIGSRFHFTGFLKGPAVERMYALTDLYVMPSVSEPFGITPLEAMLYDVPVLLSRQSGVSEVLRNALTVDFWDVRAMANKIIAVLLHPPLANEIVRHCREELRAIRWDNAAEAVTAVYETVVKRKGA